MARKALITGISGQDGSYLAEFLLEKGYEVHGILRRQSIAENQDQRLGTASQYVQTYYGDVTDQASLEHIFATVKPDEVYNLAGQSHVRVSFDIPIYTLQVNALGAVSVLDTARRIVPECRYYQASSSEMFGNTVDEDGCQRETTPMHPVSPYGCAKLLAFNMVQHYRRAYGMFAANGILFNHESPRRGSNFVTAKVVKQAVEIGRGRRDKLELGNMDSARDWGCSKDYVRAMWTILQQDEPDDFVVATGVAHTVRELCEYVFGQMGMNYQDHVVQNPQFMRPEELKYLRGDPTKIRKRTGWRPTYTFESMLDEILEHWLERIPLP